jgi:Fic family protein
MSELKPKETFEFMNSQLWLNYTHEKYLDEEDTMRRAGDGKRPSNWSETWTKIVQLRKIGAVPLFLNSTQIKFWYFPSDSITKKITEIEKLGNKLYDKITSGDKGLQKEFIFNAAVEEAVTSAIYEGANTTRAEAKQLIESERTPLTKDDWMLINNYEALHWIKKNSNSQVTLDLILKINQIVTKNTLDEVDEKYCGKFRDDKVFVRNKLNKIVHEGIEYSKIEEALSESINIVTAHPRYIHPIIKGIILHYLIAYIHPFFDGNGRTARTLFYFKSIKHNLKFVELLSISAHLKNTGNQYERSFETVKSHDWDLTYFINYCLESLLAALKAVEGKVNNLLKINWLKSEYSFSDNQIRLLQKLYLSKYRPIDIEKYAQEIGKSREIARQELKALVEHKFMREKKEGKKYIYLIEAKYLKEIIGQLELRQLL